jgi:hypothetical protein
MKVKLKTHGGLAAAIRRGQPTLVVDTDTLPKTAADELTRLVAAAKAAPAQNEESPSRGGDLMGYTITVEGDGPPVLMQQSDTTASPAFKALCRWLEDHSRKN